MFSFSKKSRENVNTKNTTSNQEDMIMKESWYVAELRKTIEGRRTKEREKREEEAKYSHEELYQQMVEESAITIIRQLDNDIRYNKDFEDNVLVAEAYKAIIVTKDFKLYTGVAIRPINPKTKKLCFDKTFKFESKDEVEKFVEDVRKNLPSEVVCTSKIQSELGQYPEATMYTFTLSVDMT